MKGVSVKMAQTSDTYSSLLDASVGVGANDRGRGDRVTGLPYPYL